MKRAASATSSSVSSRLEKKAKEDVAATQMVSKELWKKFYDVASHLGAFKQEVTLSSGDVIVMQQGPIQELSARFEEALRENQASSFLAKLEAVLLDLGYSRHPYAPKRSDYTRSEHALFTETGDLNREVLALQVEAFPPAFYVKKSKTN
jgi:hypothetical protein